MISLSGPPELLSTHEMAEADRLTIAAGTPGTVLMEHAGQAIAREATRLLAQSRSGQGGGQVAVLCGPGNNGGDGFVVARLLAAHGFDVSVGLLGEASALKGDAASAFSNMTGAEWSGRIEPLKTLLTSPAFQHVDIIIDALFGAGLARDLDGAAREAVLAANDWTRRTGRPILAVDVPSGLDGSTGLVRGVAIEAGETVTFFRLKPGHLLLPGRLLCGSVRIADIGIEPDVLRIIQPKTFANGPALWAQDFPFPGVTGHKYARGHALVLSGPMHQTGAARLSARGALRAGSGLVTVATSREALPIHAAALTAIMTRLCEESGDLSQLLEDKRFNAVIMGPGLGVGAATRAFVLAALESVRPDAEAKRSLVLDADALTSFAGDLPVLAAAIKASGATVVLTPHDGEFQRLFGEVAKEEGKLARVRAASALSGAIVLLKGPDTTVAAPDGRASIAYDLPAWLATAGSGDVLAGIIGGLLAQGMPPFEAVSSAVWLHGAAAHDFGPGLISEDIPEHLPPVLKCLMESGVG